MSYRVRSRARGFALGDARQGPGMRTAVGLLVAVLAVAGSWAGWRTLHPSETGGAIPVIHADTRPLKVPPADPGGMRVPDQDMDVLNRINAPEPKVEQLLPPPETPLPRPAAAPSEPALTDLPAAPPRRRSARRRRQHRQSRNCRKRRRDGARGRSDGDVGADRGASCRACRRAAAGVAPPPRLRPRASAAGGYSLPRCARPKPRAGMEPAEARARRSPGPARNGERAHRSRRARRLLSHRGRPDRRRGDGAAHLHGTQRAARSGASLSSREPLAAIFGVRGTGAFAGRARLLPRRRSARLHPVRAQLRRRRTRCGRWSRRCATRSGATTRRC